jgi:hypothetical protein
MQQIKIFKKEITGANIIEVCAGTNSPMGGDTGHGGRTVFPISDLASTDMRMAINGSPAQPIESFMLVFGGDSEFNTFVEALRFALSIFEGDRERIESVKIP